MNDAERDAWLREALRHAPDAQALPPRGVSDTILAQARAAARDAVAPPSRSRDGAANPLLAFWRWLGRPPVAAGFASVMAATLVGLMWWDRPMDETVARRPEAAVADRPAAPSPSRTGATVREAATAPSDAAAAQVAATPAKNNGSAEGAGARRPSPAGSPTVAGDARREVVPVEDARKKLADARAKEEVAPPAERKVAAPAPFPSTEDRRSALSGKMEPQAKSKDVGDLAKPAGDAAAAAAGTAPTAAAASPRAAAEPAAASPPAVGGLRAQSEMAAARRSSVDEIARAPAANRVERDAGQSTPPAGVASDRAPAASPAPSVRGGALGDLGEKQASAFATPPAATATPATPPAAPARPARSEAAQRARPDTAAAPLAPVLAAIATEPARWSRTSASGSIVALDAGWRDWLGELDAAAAGLWRAAGDRAAENERGGAALRLVAPGRGPLTVRLDETTARLDGASPGERWQATLPAPAAERLRAAARRLPP